MNLENREELEALAGEYVLGVLSSADAHEIERAMQTNRELRRWVYYWENQLLALTSAAVPIRPEPTLWAGIERELAARADPITAAAWPKTESRAGLWQSLNFWRFGSFVGFAATAALLWFVFAGQPFETAPTYVAVLLAPDKSAGYLVQGDRGSGVHLIPLASTSPAADKTLQFWTKQEGAKGPTSLGVVPANRKVHVKPDRLPGLEANQLFEITLEPAGGSPIGRPTGAVLFVGRAVKSI